MYVESIKKDLYRAIGLGPWFVNSYLKNRAFGGPEEGGWWYDIFQPVNSAMNGKFFSIEEAEQHSSCVRTMYDEMNEDRNSDLNSVNCEWKYVVLIQDHLPRPEPTVRPHYE